MNDFINRHQTSRRSVPLRRPWMQPTSLRSAAPACKTGTAQPMQCFEHNALSVADAGLQSSSVTDSAFYFCYF
jgi:hypothetical protein